MHWLRCLVFFAAFYGFTFTSEHILGMLNTAVDAISHNNLALFLSRSHPTDPPHSHPSGSDGSPSHRDTQLGLMGVDHRIRVLFNQGISAAMRAAYQSGWRQYCKFCEKNGLCLLPLNEPTICKLAAVMSESVGGGTIHSY